MRSWCNVRANEEARMKKQKKTNTTFVGAHLTPEEHAKMRECAKAGVRSLANELRIAIRKHLGMMPEQA